MHQLPSPDPTDEPTDEPMDGPLLAVWATPETPADLAAAAAWAPSLAQAFVGLACELALVLDEHGLILSVAHSELPGLQAAAPGWLGQRWACIASADSQGKIQALLAEVASQGVARRRELTLATQPPLPVAFAALRLGPEGPTLALGHDLRAAAGLQQRFLRAQRELEQGYQLALDQLAHQASQDRLAPAQAVRAMATLLPAAARLLVQHDPAEPQVSGAARRLGKRQEQARVARRRTARRR